MNILIMKNCKHAKSEEPDLQRMCCPIGRPNTEVGVGRANLNLATLWLSCVRLTSSKSLNFSGSRQPINTNYCTNNSCSAVTFHSKVPF